MKPGTRLILSLLRAMPDGVTSLDALDMAGCARLAARVGELRGDGFRIDTEWVTTPSQKRIARYHLVEPRAVKQEALPW